jgi:hypothetical protein
MPPAHAGLTCPHRLPTARLTPAHTRPPPPRPHTQGASDALRRLRLVRGLRNAGGEYNCFLNVIIQSLWHLPSFRAALLVRPLPAAAACEAGAPGGADAAVLRALRSVFGAMAAAPAADAGAPSSGGASSGGGGEAGWLVDPAALREALSRLGDAGGAAVGMELAEMHDAAEVFDEVLAALHRAEAGQGSGGGGGAAAADPRLPRRVRARADAFAPPPGLAAVRLAGAGSGAPAAPAPAGRGRGGAAAAAAPAPAPGGVGRLGGSAPPPASMAHRVFGLDVQVVAPPDDGGDGKAPAAPAAPAAPGGALDAQEFLKFAHHVHAEVGISLVVERAPVNARGWLSLHCTAPASAVGRALTRLALGPSTPSPPSTRPQVLRECYNRLFDAPFSDALCAADIQEDAAPPAAGPDAAGAAQQARHHPRHATGTRTVLLRRPKVFTLALIWESPQVRARGPPSFPLRRLAAGPQPGCCLWAGPRPRTSPLFNNRPC